MPAGRPRKSDPEKVLDTVMKTFWKQGYSGTSVNDLAAASGMAKPGLYANFGDKDAIFEKALSKYLNEVTDPLLQVLGQCSRPLRDSIGGFLERVAASAASPAGPKGCLVALCLLESAEMSEHLQDMSRRLNLQRRDAFLKRLQSAAREELPAGHDCEALADFFSGQVISLTALARAGRPEPELQRIARTALSILPQPSRQPPGQGQCNSPFHA